MRGGLTSTTKKNTRPEFAFNIKINKLNLWRERHNVFCRKQKKTESVEQFNMDLVGLSS